MKSSSPASIAIAQGLDLSAALKHWVLTPVEADYWQHKLRDYKPEHIARAFEDYWGEESNFPTPAQIISRIREYIANEQPSAAERMREQLAKKSPCEGYGEEK